jgi:hypothetical protein
MAMAIPMIIMAASAAVSIIGQQQAAKAEQQGAEFQAKQFEQRAGQERAAAQRQSLEQRRQAGLAISRAQAVTGGGGTDDGVLDQIGRIAGEGEYNALGALYEGEESARGQEMQATGLRMEGKAARRAANWKSASTVLSTASSMYGSYGQGGAFGGGRG